MHAIDIHKVMSMDATMLTEMCTMIVQDTEIDITAGGRVGRPTDCTA